MASLTERQKRNIAYLIERGRSKAEVARNFGISQETVDKVLGERMVQPRRHSAWTEAEKAFVRDNYAELGAVGCRKVLQTHTVGSIQKMASVLGATGNGRGPKHSKWKVIEGGADGEQV